MASTHLETPCEMPPTEAGPLKNKVIPYWDDLRVGGLRKMDNSRSLGGARGGYARIGVLTAKSRHFYRPLPSS